MSDLSPLCAQERTWITAAFVVGGLIPLPHPHILMTQWQPPKREPPKTKAELREMLAEAVRNTQAENKRLRQAKRDRGKKGSLTHI